MPRIILQYSVGEACEKAQAGLATVIRGQPTRLLFCAATSRPETPAWQAETRGWLPAWE